MSRTRILFLPCFFGVPSHFIPLVKLYQRLPKDQYEVAFVRPDMSAGQIGTHNPGAAYYYSDEFLSHFDIPVLPLKQRFGVMNELAAYARFAPDLIIDDTNLTTALARQLKWYPRLTIARTGFFGVTPAVAPYPYGTSALIDLYQVPAPFRNRMPATVDGYFEAEGYVVPGVRSLEYVPDLTNRDLPVFFSGPLLMDAQEELVLLSDPLEQFLHANRDRRIAYLTLGIDASKNPHSQVLESLHELLRRDFAVITNVKSPQPLADGRYFHTSTVPMHYVCSRASLIVHVSGSATYHYPILHAKPAITIGTQIREREEIAQTLCRRGLSLHLPAPAEAEDFPSLFAAALDRLDQGSHPFDADLGERLNAHRLEIETALELFDLGAVIEATIARGKASRAG